MSALLWLAAEAILLTLVLGSLLSS